MAQKIRKPAVKKNRSNLGTGVVHIQSTFNNTIVTITNLTGDTIAWSRAAPELLDRARILWSARHRRRMTAGLQVDWMPRE